MWNDWTEWSECSKTCGAGLKTMTRTKSVEESGGGICEGIDEDEMICNEDECPVVMSMQF